MATPRTTRFFFLKDNNSNRGIWYLLLIWFIANIITTSFLELSNDEAYYWMYSQNLDWGYFDHPPMIALWNWIGYSILPNEIGVRLPSILLTTATIYFIYLTVKPQSIRVFSLLIFSLIGLNLTGFLSLPDNPLLFFTAAFFYQYRRYIENDSVKNSLILGIICEANHK